VLVEVAVEPLRFCAERANRFVIKPLEVARLEALEEDRVPAKLGVEVLDRAAAFDPRAGIGGDFCVL